MKSKSVLWSLAALIVTTSSFAANIQIERQKNDAYVVDQTLMLQKPNSRWNARTLPRDEAPIQWMIRQEGRNPLMQLRYHTQETGMKGKNLEQFTKQLQRQYVHQGLKIKNVKYEKNEGQKMAVINAWNPTTHEHFLIGAWHIKDKGYYLECSAEEKDFQTMLPDFKGALQTARVIK